MIKYSESDGKSECGAVYTDLTIIGRLVEILHTKDIEELEIRYKVANIEDRIAEIIERNILES